MKFSKFKFRAECLQDVLKLFLSMHYLFVEEEMTITSLGEGLPDVEIEFSTAYTLVQIYSILDGIMDLHVIKQTILPAEQYTGSRNYNL